MEQKTFDIYKKDNGTKVQIGENVIVIDDNERLRLLNLFLSIKDTKKLFPSGLEGICLMYEDGLIAANISISKICNSGAKYLLFVYHQTPKSINYEANTFMLSENIVDKYIESLS